MTRNKKKSLRTNLSLKKRLLLIPGILLVIGGAGVGYRLHFESKASTCTVDSKLVNSCRPWLGAESNNHGASGFRGRIEEHEKRIGRQLDIVHEYHPLGSYSLSNDEKYFINRPNTLLLTSFKPADQWARAAGGDTAINENIDRMADSVKGIAPKKILLSVYHEPENDVSSGASNCAANIYAGKSGTPAEYRAMWQNVRNRFNAKGVTNVVWVMNYMGFTKWNCMHKALWPGNALVDWIMWDPYYGNNGSFNGEVGNFYKWMETNGDANHAFTSKAWGIAEWGSWQSNQNDVKASYAQALTSLRAGTFPRIKAYIVWDNKATNDSRLNRTASGVLDNTEQAAYNAFAQDPRFTDSFYTQTTTPGGDTTSPTVSIVSPNQAASVSGTITISANASDNVGISRVDFFVEGSLIKSDVFGGDGWSVGWDTRSVINGTKTLKVSAYDNAGNSATTSRSVTVANTQPQPTTNPTQPSSDGPETYYDDPDYYDEYDYYSDEPDPADVAYGVDVAYGEDITVDYIDTPGTESYDHVALDGSLLSDPELLSQIVKVEYFKGSRLLAVLVKPPFALEIKKLPKNSLPPGRHSLKQRIYFKDGSIAEKERIVDIRATPIRSIDKNDYAKRVAVVMVGIVMVLILGVLGIWYRMLRPKGITLSQLIPRKKAAEEEQWQYRPNTFFYTDPTLPPSPFQDPLSGVYDQSLTPQITTSGHAQSGAELTRRPGKETLGQIPVQVYAPSSSMNNISSDGSYENSVNNVNIQAPVKPNFDQRLKAEDIVREPYFPESKNPPHLS